MNPPKLVSIITPNYNSEMFIEETIDSVQKQVYTNWELIVVDDNSNDNSYLKAIEFSRGDKRIRVITNQTQTKGGAACRNIGIEAAKGDWLMFLDSDDVLSPNCLQVRMESVDKNQSLDLGIFNMGVYLGSHFEAKECLNLPLNESNALSIAKKFLSYTIPFPITCCLWKAEFIKKNNIHFNLGFQRLQDVEFHANVFFNFNPTYFYFKDQIADCYYRRVTVSDVKYSEKFIEKIVQSFGLFIEVFYQQIERMNGDKNVFFDSLNEFKKKAFEHILLQYPLYSFKSILQLHNQLSAYPNLRFKVSILRILFFGILNKLGLNKINGFGVYRLWKILTK